MLQIRSRNAPFDQRDHWRHFARGAAIDSGGAKVLARISQLEALLFVLMVVAATGMARGVAPGY